MAVSKEAVQRRLASKKTQAKREVPPLIKEAMARKAIRHLVVGE